MATDHGHAHHRLERHLADEPDGLDRDDLTDGYVRVEELGVGRRDHDVGIRDPVEATTGTDAVDSGDHRLPDLLVPRGEVEVPPLD